MVTSVRGRLRVLDNVQSANGRLENLEYGPRYLVLDPAACSLHIFPISISEGHFFFSFL